MFGQMTAGSWIYIGTQGILQGTYQTFAAAGAEALRRAVARRAHDPDRRARRHGRRAAARGDARRRGDPLRRGRPGAHRAAARDALPRRGDRVARRRARARARRGARGARALGRPARQRRRRRAGARAARRALRPRHRPDGGARPADRLRPERDDASTRRPRCARPIRTSTSGAPARRSPSTSRRCSSTSGPGAMFSIMATTCEVRPKQLA